MMVHEMIFIGLISFLVIAQYIAVIADIRNKRALKWEKIVGLIPMAPYLLMVLVGLEYLVRKLIINEEDERSIR